MKMNLVLLLLLISSFINNVTAQEINQDRVTFSTQEQIDNFPKNHPELTRIVLDVYIKETVPNDITNLDGLYPIMGIKGNLMLLKNENLMSLSGLKNLTSIGGDLYVSNNTSLTSFHGLENLTSIASHFSVSDNTSLTSLNGLENLSFIGGNLRISNNASLNSVSSLHNLRLIRGKVFVYDNSSLGNPDNLENQSVDIEILENKTKKMKPHEIWVIPMDRSSTLRGYLSGVGDNEITLLNKLNKSRITGTTKSIDFQNIETIEFRKERQIKKGVYFGALTGFAVGGIIGLAGGDNDSWDAEANAVVGGVLLTIPGAIIGGIVGSMKIVIPINGNHETFKNQREELMKYKILD